MVAANSIVTTPSSATVSEMSSPTVDSAVISYSASRATTKRSGAAIRVSGIQVVGDLAQHRGDLRAVSAVRVLAATEAHADSVEQLHEVLDHDCHVIRGTPVELAEAGRTVEN